MPAIRERWEHKSRWRGIFLHNNLGGRMFSVRGTRVQPV
uniref:Uncharacterized protein n=1 Tax=Anguilla anguilla TaxID=7936 RepID=A0A0E9XJF2_ANGAN